MEEYLEIQKPELGYTYEFEVDQLSQMSECLEAHGFAIVKDVLPPELVESLKQAVFRWHGSKQSVRTRTEPDPDTLGWSLDRVLGSCSDTNPL